MKPTLIDNGCKNRVKPTFLRDIKTEALLVFARTGLEQYFAQLRAAGIKPTVGSEDDTSYIYDTLQKLLHDLQQCVVDAEYIQAITARAAQDRRFVPLYQQEKPLIEYYNVLVHAVEQHYKDEPLFLPELLVICALSIWILEEEKSMHHYPFLMQIDWLELMGRFESNRHEFEKEGACHISKIHDFSHKLIQKLINKKLQIKQTKKSSAKRKRKS
jgi:hypothetical protein